MVLDQSPRISQHQLVCLLPRRSFEHLPHKVLQCKTHSPALRPGLARVQLRVKYQQPSGSIHKQLLNFHLTHALQHVQDFPFLS
uniref:Uncharacterized protein n=1 Tax=Rhizophora mucronata TaxID=61149 RepID=A0A2P2P0L7_RHIMU